MAHTRTGPLVAVAQVGLSLALAGIAWQVDTARREGVPPPYYEPPATGAAPVVTGGGPSGGDVFSIAIDPRTPSTVYALAGDSVFKSLDGGGSWKSVTRLLNHNLPTITIDPSNPSHLVLPVNSAIVRTTNAGASWYSIEAGSQQPGVSGGLLYAVDHVAFHQSRDGGDTWRNLTGVGELRSHSYSAFASDARRPSLLYLGLFENGLLKSVDGGETWKPAERGLPADRVTAIAIDPSNPDIAYAGLNDSGIFMTRDGGGAWTAVNLGLGNSHISSLAIDPSRPSVVYAGTEDGVFKTVDAGVRWTATRGLRATTVYTLAIDPSRTSVIYAGCLHGGGIFKSIDAGETWFPARSGLAAAWITFLVQGRGAASMYAATNQDVFAYRGGRWVSIASSRDSLEGESVSALAADLVNPDTVYVGTSVEARPWRGHIYRSADGGGTWSAADAGLQSKPLSYLAVDPSNGAELWASTFDGLFTSHDAGASWIEVRWNKASLGGYRPVMDPIYPTPMYVLQPRLNLLKSTDRGTTWSSATKGLPTEQRDGQILSIAIDPTAQNVLYVSQWSMAQGRPPLYKSTDGGISWTPWGSRLPIPGLSCLAIDPRNPRLLLGAGRRMLRSIDGGVSWSEGSTGLPDTFIRAIVFDTARAGTAYAGTDHGVFVSVDGGITWRPTDSR